MKILIVGAGIAGTSLAYWLQRGGHEPTLVERAPELRRGGYLMDFWGAGFDVAERMNLVPELMSKGFRLRELRQVNAKGRVIAAFEPELFVRETGGRYLSIPRGELAATIHAALHDRVETVFGDSVSALEDDGSRVHVTFESGNVRSYDLVIGADGLHSQVRRLVFGAEAEFEKFLGISVAAFDIVGYQPRDELTAVMYTQVGLQVTRVAMPDDATMFLFSFLDQGQAAGQGVAAQQAVLRSHFASAGWEVPRILELMPSARTFYFDRVSQIWMPTWSRGRVALVGDAAACVSLLAGQGAALAMVEAYVLAAELSRPQLAPARAFANYEARLAAFLRSKQVAAARLSSIFAPRNAWQLFLRNSVMKLIALPFVADLAMGSSLRDRIELPAAAGD